MPSRGLARAGDGAVSNDVARASDHVPSLRHEDCGADRLGAKTLAKSHTRAVTRM